jgi:hypothetical protein
MDFDVRCRCSSKNNSIKVIDGWIRTALTFEFIRDTCFLCPGTLTVMERTRVAAASQTRTQTVTSLWLVTLVATASRSVAGLYLRGNHWFELGRNVCQVDARVSGRCARVYYVCVRTCVRCARAYV